MKITTVITGHGNYASGIKSSLLLLSSLPANYCFVDFVEDMTPDQLAKKLLSVVKANSECVFFTDLLGGTPYKEAAKLSVNNDKYEVVTGCNLGSLLETTYNSYQNVSDYANDLVNTSKQGTQLFVLSNDDLFEEKTDFEDGI
ncbi:PTS sugar transporter [Pediococcus siamensis]|uniref:PTS sugar transporter subunit IIA domain-containing protein n=1 Tax=Pediococcus siamensis TaxID=381829 RepID=UPI0039A1A983